MELRSLRHKVSGDVFRLVFFGDAHVGVVHCEEDRLCRDVEKIADDPECRTILIGDAIDAINFSDKRFDPECIKPTYQLKDLAKLAQIQTADFVSMVAPMRDRIDGFLSGNHEYEALKRYHYDVTDGIHAGLDLSLSAHLKTAAILSYKIESERCPLLSFTVYVEHGTGSSSNPQAALTRIKRKALDIDADIYAMGHHHKRIYDVIPQMIQVVEGDNLRLREKRRGFVCTGSYLKTYMEGTSGYGERRSYSPVELGSVVVEWDLKARRFEIFNW